MYCPNCKKPMEFGKIELDESSEEHMVCSYCGTEVEELMYLTRAEAKLLELEFSTHFINRDRYESTQPLIKRIFHFAETGKVD